MPNAHPTTGFLDVPSAQLYYEVAGNGSAFVMIHAGIANLRMWDAQAEAFSPHFRVIRYDTRGFGRSRTLEASEFTNQDDVLALMDQLGVDQAHVMGCSRGGAIALDFALEHPERVRSIVWVCGGVGGLEYTPIAADQPIIERFNQMEAAYEAKEWEHLNELEAHFWVDGAAQPAGRADEKVYQQVLEMNRLNVFRDEPEPAALPLDPPAVGRLGELKVPVLAIIGDLDPPNGLAAADYLAEHAPNGRKVVFHGTAHVPNLERPEEFNRVVAEFLSGLNG